MNQAIGQGIFEISAYDKHIGVFEGQYPVPQGVTYNTWLIRDEQIALLDTVDARCTEEWLAELEAVLEGRMPDYLVISHMEPDHSGAIAALTAKYPALTLVGNAKSFAMLDQFEADAPIAAQRCTVKDGETLPLGAHTLRFLFAPMVHWPEVMLAYEEQEGILFSADAFGRFGDADPTSPWADEARRYYANIVGKYGAQVQAVLKKAGALKLNAVCPLHGPVLTGENLQEALRLYGLWSAWQPEDEGVLVVAAGFHGHTAAAGAFAAQAVREQGRDAVCIDLSQTHPSYAVGEAFKYRHILLAAATYDGGFAPAMETFLSAIRQKSLQHRVFALVENGTWAPMAAKGMRAALEGLKNTQVLDSQVSIKSAMQAQSREALAALCGALLEA